MTTPGSDPRYDALAELALGTLPEGERPTLEAWVAADAAAQSQLRALREAVAVLTVAIPIVEPPATLRDRVLAIAGDAGARVADAPPASTAPRASTAGGPATSWATAGWWLAAASTLLAIGLGIYAARLRSDVAQLSASLDTTAARLATAEAE
ncbi:MAG TPA: hypothetical protein VMF13_12305, partial [Luteitalea sp.]|nr:hypothetical protein [Luteitalea sp.]